MWSASSFAAAYKIDPAQSSVKRAAKKVVKALGGHDGVIKIKEGTLDLEGKKEKGRFVIDLTTIEATDLKDDPTNKKKLEGHLKSDDFFAVSKHPEAVFVVKQMKQDAKDKTQYQVDGDLTIKGITKPLSIPAKVSEKSGKIEISSDFTIKRNDWDIRYNSPSFFDLKELGDKAIEDEIKFDIDLVGVKK
jgi:polyisoprenoid-binding protein YceI